MRCESASAHSGVWKPIAANRACELACLLKAVPVDQRNVGTDRGVFGYVPIEAIAYLDFEILGGDVIEKLLGLQIRRVDDRDDLEQLVKGNRYRGRLHVTRDHLSLPRATQSTR